MDLRSQTRDELEAQFAGWNQPAYRVTQLLEWLYVHGASSLEEMSNLPKALRQQLAKHYSLRPLELVRKQGSKDSTRKFLWRLADHSLIESVLIAASPALYGDASDRQTLCISTQVGCAYGCRFCASGLLGFKRNLDVEEIVDQVCAVERSERGEERGPLLSPSLQVHGEDIVPGRDELRPASHETTTKAAASASTAG